MRPLSPTLFALVIAASAGAQEVGDRSVGSNTYRVQMFDFDRFYVYGGVGDPSPPGELHHITMTLRSGTSQRPSDGEVQAELRIPALHIRNQSRDGGDSTSYEAIWPENWLRFVPRDGPSGVRLAITDEAEDWQGVRSVVFSIDLIARDLDCTGDRVCRRGNTQRERREVAFTVPPEGFGLTCGERNTATFVLLDGWPNLFSQNAEMSSSWSASLGRFTESDGPDISPIGARVCVTDTLSLPVFDLPIFRPSDS